MNIHIDDEWIEWMSQERIEQMCQADPSSVRILVDNVFGLARVSVPNNGSEKVAPPTRYPIANAVLRGPMAIPGAIVARKRYKDVDIFLLDFGHVDRTLVGRFLRLCVEEDELLSLHYSPRSEYDDILLHTSDGLCFNRYTDFLVHCLETTGIDILNELRNRPRHRFPVSTDKIHKMHVVKKRKV